MSNTNTKGTESMDSIATLSTAWDWVLRLREDNLSQDDVASWLSWYEADEQHKQAFEEMQALWRNADRLVEGPRATSLAQLLGSSPVPPRSSASRAPAARTPRRFKWTSWAPALAAVALIVTIGASFWQLDGLRFRDTPPPATATPGVVHQTLPDGSRVDLAAKSSMGVQFTDAERSIELRGGEAFFSVARQPNRPFVVKVGGIRVRALGTAFNVRHSADRVVVSVTEGTVEVSSGAASPPTQLAAGKRGVWTAGSAGPAISAVDASRALAWRQGRLEYVNEPLSSVIADINRYTKRPVTIRDDAVAQLTFSGTVFTDATDVWLEALPRVFPVSVETSASGDVLIANR